MRALDILMNEHRLIERVMHALNGYVTRLQNGEDLPIGDLGKFATFFREFADRCHHGKEEDILFATMTEHGFSRQMGPIAVMLHEHEEGRRHVRALLEAAEHPAWTPQLRDEAIEHALGYISLLSAHIHKEDNILYPMAAQEVPGERMEAMAQQFDAFEENVTGKGVHEQFHALAHELIERYARDTAA